MTSFDGDTVVPAEAGAAALGLLRTALAEGSGSEGFVVFTFGDPLAFGFPFAFGSFLVGLAEGFGELPVGRSFGPFSPLSSDSLSMSSRTMAHSCAQGWVPTLFDLISKGAQRQKPSIQIEHD